MVSLFCPISSSHSFVALSHSAFLTFLAQPARQWAIDANPAPVALVSESGCLGTAAVALKMLLGVVDGMFDDCVEGDEKRSGRAITSTIAEVIPLLEEALNGHG